MIRDLLTSDLGLLTLTVVLFVAGGAIHRRTRLMLLHPVLMTFVAMIVLLQWLKVPYAAYMEATEVLDFALGLSVVSLGYLLYEQSERLSRNLLPVLAATLMGCVAGVLSVVWIAAAMGADRVILNSIAPKSVTVPIAIAIAEPLGGVVSLTSVVVFCVGIFGAIFGPSILRWGGVKSHEAVGFSLGAASHGIGTSRAVEIGAIEGAMSGLAMALMGVATALLTPLLEQYLY
ncbi:MAG: LrgB family protein [Alistipes sp.]|nr:LrgB family protein [Alistipes sp.]MBR3773370.1 LrgB family protein [Alistipes sp.]